MRKAVQRFLPTALSPQQGTLKKSLKIDSINLINDFYIDLDEPHKQFKPGETVTGVAVLDLKKNIADVNITLTLVGYIKLKQNPTAATTRNRPTLLFRHTSVIYGPDPNDFSNNNNNNNNTPNGLSKGEHRFPFVMKLPRKNILTSISFEKGAISYQLKASINHNKGCSPPSSTASSPISSSSSASGSSNSSSSNNNNNNNNNNVAPNPKNAIHHCEKNLQIVVPINVAKIPKPQTKYAHLRISDKKLFKTVSSSSTINSNTTQSTNNSDASADASSIPTSNMLQPFKDQTMVKLAVDLPQSGYLRGELVPLKININHYKPIQSSTGIIVTLIRLCRVDNGPETPIQTFRKDLSQTIAPLYIDPETLTGEISTSLKIPIDCFPTIVGSDIVSFQYYIEVLANISNKKIIKTNSNQSKKNPNQSNKFSHSLVFDLDFQDREMTLQENGMVNVDNLKRAKNFLGLNTEIIVGTERTLKKLNDIGKKTIISNACSLEANNHHNNNNNNNNNNQISTINESPPISDLDGLSQNSISPLSMNGGLIVDDSNHQSEINDIFYSTAGNNFQNLSEKEVLRLKEEALLPSDPTILNGSTPAPSYSNGNNEEFSAPPLTTNHQQINDKAELERSRLINMESEPPEFDYVPEYNPPTPPDSSRCPSVSESIHSIPPPPPPPSSSSDMGTLTTGGN